MFKRLCALLGVGAILVTPSVGTADEATTRAIDLPVRLASGPTQVAKKPEASLQVMEEHYDTGELKVKQTVIRTEEGETVRTGPWQMLNRDGKVIAHGHFVKNERHGDWFHIHKSLSPNFDLLSSNSEIVFAETGYNAFQAPFTSQASFKEGKLHGTWTMRDAGNRLMSEWDYSDGRRDGKAIWYYANGSVKAELNFKSGLLHGKRQHFDRTARLSKDETWIEGRQVVVEIDYFDEDKTQKKSQTTSLYSTYKIHTPDDWWNAAPVTYAKPKSSVGVQHGPMITFFPNGQKESEGHYVHGDRHGNFVWWFDNGKMNSRGQYHKDTPVGTWNWLHANGEKAAEGLYAKGKPTGIWRYWTDKGALRMKQDYSGENAEIVAASEEEREAVLKSAKLVPGFKGDVR